VVESSFGNPGHGMLSNLRYRRLGAYPPRIESEMGVDGTAPWCAKPQIYPSAPEMAPASL
jgi:hypothetical protein